MGLGGNINTPTIRYVLGYYIYCIDYVHSGVNLILTCYFVFGYNISYYNTLKLKKELFVFVLLSFFITLITFKVPKHGIPLSVLASINPWLIPQCIPDYGHLDLVHSFVWFLSNATYCSQDICSFWYFRSVVICILCVTLQLFVCSVIWCILEIWYPFCGR